MKKAKVVGKIPLRELRLRMARSHPLLKESVEHAFRKECKKN